MRTLIAALLVCGCSSTSDMATGDTETGGSSQGLTSVADTGGETGTGGNVLATGGAIATGGKTSLFATATGGARATGGSKATGGTGPAEQSGACPGLPSYAGEPLSSIISSGRKCFDTSRSSYCAAGACEICPSAAGYKNCDGLDANGCETWVMDQPGQACP